MVHYWLGVQHAPECLTYDRFQQVKRAATWAASEYSTVRRDLGTGIIHSDLSGQNLIVRSTDIAAIDLEACSIGPFVQDLAMTLTYFTDRADLNELRNAVVKGYLKLRRLNKVELRSFELFYVLNALRDLREIFTWPRLTFKSWGPDVLETSLRQLERYQHLFSTEEETLLLAH